MSGSVSRLFVAYSVGSLILETLLYESAGRRAAPARDKATRRRLDWPKYKILSTRTKYKELRVFTEELKSKAVATETDKILFCSKDFSSGEISREI